MSEAEEPKKGPITVDLEEVSSWKRVAHVAVEPDHMEKLRDAAARKLASKVRMDGFRPGKVPLRVVRTQLVADVEQRALEALVPESYKVVLDSYADLHPVSDPRVENLELPEGEDIRFDLVIEVRPEIEITGLEAVEATRVMPPVTDARVEQAIEELLERHAHWHEKAEGGAQEGDAVLIDYAPLDGEGNPQPDEGETDKPLLLGSGGVLPEFNAALVGMQAGEDTDVEVSYPVDYPNEDLRGSIRKIRVQLKQVREKHAPELTDEFAAEHTPLESVEALREDVRRQLERNTKQESDRHLRDQLVDQLIAINDIPTPPSLEARYVQAIVTDLERNSGQELDEERREKLAEAYKPMAQRMVRRLILLDNLRRSRGIEVSDEELDAKIAELAAEEGSTPEDLRQAIDRAGNLDRLRGDLEEEKVFALLEQSAKIAVTEEIPAEPDAPASAGGTDMAAESKE